MSDTKRNYELGYHINPELEEAQIAQTKTELEEIIMSNGGIITFSKEPERTRLSYTVKHKNNSFFGYIQFSSENSEELLNKLQEYIKLHGNIFRSLVVKLPSDAEKNQAMLRQMKMRERADRLPKPAQKAPATPEENKKLEEQLEDIIEKL